MVTATCFGTSNWPTVYDFCCSLGSEQPRTLTLQWCCSRFCWRIWISNTAALYNRRSHSYCSTTSDATNRIFRFVLSGFMLTDFKHQNTFIGNEEHQCMKTTVRCFRGCRELMWQLIICTASPKEVPCHSRHISCFLSLNGATHDQQTEWSSPLKPSMLLQLNASNYTQKCPFVPILYHPIQPPLHWRVFLWDNYCLELMS